MVKAMCRETGLILAAGVALCAAAYYSGLDAWLAHALYHPESRWAYAVRQWSGPVLGLPVILGAMTLFFSPKWNKKRADLHKMAALMVMAVLLGVGLLNQVIFQSVADRARPRDSILVSSGNESLHGHSMPSGHAAMGFAFVAPYFLLRKRKPKAARAFLCFGIAAGLFIGLSRMVLGAHFLSDVLMAGVVALASGRVFTEFVERVGIIGRRWWLGGLAIALAALVLGNKFTMVFEVPVGVEFSRTKLPCPLEVAHDPAAGEPRLEIALTGYGAPVSQIYPIDVHGVVKLRKWGIYHSLACRAVLHAPEVSYD